MHMMHTDIYTYIYLSYIIHTYTVMVDSVKVAIS
jgi:hypothetical protein